VHAKAREAPSIDAASFCSCASESIRLAICIVKAPDGDRFMVIGEHSSENFVYDPSFLGIERSPDLIIIQVTSTVGNTKEQKVAFFRQMADELNRRLSVRREDVFISLVFVDREDWSFGNGEPW
jgi:hypothetical protein